jgi:hypothetical protein
MTSMNKRKQYVEQFEPLKKFVAVRFILCQEIKKRLLFNITRHLH